MAGQHVGAGHVRALQQGVQAIVRDLNALYRSQPALYESDCFPEGFSWIDCHDSDNSIISYIRRAKDPDDVIIVVCNFTPVVRDSYRVGVPFDGAYAEVLNTDATCYAGSGIGNAGRVDADLIGAHGYPFSLSLQIPPLGAVVLKPFPRDRTVIEGTAAEESAGSDDDTTKAAATGDARTAEPDTAG